MYRNIFSNDFDKFLNFDNQQFCSLYKEYYEDDEFDRINEETKNFMTQLKIYKEDYFVADCLPFMNLMSQIKMYEKELRDTSLVTNNYTVIQDRIKRLNQEISDTKVTKIVYSFMEILQKQSIPIQIQLAQAISKYVQQNLSKLYNLKNQIHSQQVGEQDKKLQEQ